MGSNDLPPYAPTPLQGKPPPSHPLRPAHTRIPPRRRAPTDDLTRCSPHYAGPGPSCSDGDGSGVVGSGVGVGSGFGGSGRSVVRVGVGFGGSGSP
ncbi:hypothetical protein E7X58_29065 [Streptomyces sp. A1499]|nr:hypothetical protein E7X58_29065 [Streptomyces sp. A1499]